MCLLSSSVNPVKKKKVTILFLANKSDSVFCSDYVACLTLVLSCYSFRDVFHKLHVHGSRRIITQIFSLLLT